LKYWCGTWFASRQSSRSKRPKTAHLTIRLKHVPFIESSHDLASPGIPETVRAVRGDSAKRHSDTFGAASGAVVTGVTSSGLIAAAFKAAFRLRASLAFFAARLRFAAAALAFRVAAAFTAASLRFRAAAFAFLVAAALFAAAVRFRLAAAFFAAALRSAAFFIGRF